MRLWALRDEPSFPTAVKWPAAERTALRLPPLLPHGGGGALGRSPSCLPASDRSWESRLRLPGKGRAVWDRWVMSAHSTGRGSDDSAPVGVFVGS